MGRIRNEGIEILRTNGTDPTGSNAMGLILGTGWSDPDVLRNMGFEIQEVIHFSEVGVNPGVGAGHPNCFLLGTWHGREVVISHGRVHMYQDRAARIASESLIRRWFSVFLALMGDGRKVVITSSVGGLGPSKTGMLVKPVGLISAHLPQTYLDGNAGEFVMSEHLIWDNHPEFGIDRSHLGLLFKDAAIEADLAYDLRGRHIVVPGPGFGGREERVLWDSWDRKSVGMSLDPELRLLAVEMMTNDPDDPEYEILPGFIVTDDHDLPNHAEIQAAAKERAPNLGHFLSYVVENDWE
jgi:purine nucleoside phosphorylase